MIATVPDLAVPTHAAAVVVNDKPGEPLKVRPLMPENHQVAPPAIDRLCR